MCLLVKSHLTLERDGGIYNQSPKAMYEFRLKLIKLMGNWLISRLVIVSFRSILIYVPCFWYVSLDNKYDKEDDTQILLPTPINSCENNIRF